MDQDALQFCCAWLKPAVRPFSYRILFVALPNAPGSLSAVAWEGQHAPRMAISRRSGDNSVYLAGAGRGEEERRWGCWLYSRFWHRHLHVALSDALAQIFHKGGKANCKGYTLQQVCQCSLGGSAGGHRRVYGVLKPFHSSNSLQCMALSSHPKGAILYFVITLNWELIWTLPVLWVSNH